MKKNWDEEIKLHDNRKHWEGAQALTRSGCRFCRKHLPCEVTPGGVRRQASSDFLFLIFCCFWSPKLSRWRRGDVSCHWPWGESTGRKVGARGWELRSAGTLTHLPEPGVHGMVLCGANPPNERIMSILQVMLLYFFLILIRETGKLYFKDDVCASFSETCTGCVGSCSLIWWGECKLPSTEQNEASP